MILEKNVVEKVRLLNNIFSYSVPKVMVMLTLSLLATTQSLAQEEELRQKISAFVDDHIDRYEKKYLNVSDRELGDIEGSAFEWKDLFMLKSNEKKVNSIGNKGYEKIYFTFYYYYNLEDRQYALRHWLKNFIDGKNVRPGRPVRQYDSATPTIILINDQNIIICNYKCSDFSEENYKYWRKTLLNYFKEGNTMVIEIGCRGPLEWTRNAPDPKASRKLF